MKILIPQNLKNWALVLFCSSSLAYSLTATAGELTEQVNDIERDWYSTYYSNDVEDKEEAYEELLNRVRALKNAHQNETELLVWEAIVLCTYAGEKHNLSSLSMVREARDLLLRAIEENPEAMDASAYVTLGNLYYRTPGWPISFGDDDKARIYLEKALSMKPNAIDTNYFYGDFLLDQGEKDKAVEYLIKALNVPERPHQILADRKLKEDVKKTLDKVDENLYELTKKPSNSGPEVLSHRKIIDGRKG